MRDVWAVVIIVCVALVCVTTLSVTGSAGDGLLQVIATAVVPTVTIILVGSRVESKVDDVHKQVNGRMSELIARNGDESKG